MNAPEADLIEKVRPKFEKRYKIFEEVGLFSRSIDMVLWDGEIITAIEFKIGNTKKVIEQARIHLIAVDFSCICMPKRKISLKSNKLIDKYGLGVWLYDFDSDILEDTIEPRKSEIQWRLCRRTILKQFEVETWKKTIK